MNEEIRDLFAAGADIVQIDEPYMQARPEEARQYGLAALNTALEGITGRTAVHICFGYAAIIHARPSGYSFLHGTGRAAAASRSRIETAQSNLDCKRAGGPAGQADHARRHRPFRPDRRDAGAGGGAHPPRAAVRSARENIIVAPDCGMKYLPRDVADAQAARDGRRRPHRP